MVEILKEGDGELLGWHDPDDARRNMKQKSKALDDKRTTLEDAISDNVNNGDLVAIGGFGHVRVPMAAIYEMIRQGKEDLRVSGKACVHDIDVLVASGCVSEIEVTYAFGQELRGLGPASRRKAESGECEVIAENSNAGLQWRYLAAMMGIPFIPTRVLLGSDTFEKSSAKVIEDPWSGKPVCLLPACYPDVGIVHTHKCDKYGNAQIDGTTVEDFELSGACKKLIVTTENLVDKWEIQENNGNTDIPYYYVDDVVEIPYGAHPTEMPGEYYYDEKHISEWFDHSQSEEEVNEYFEKYVYGTNDFQEYLELVGGEKKLNDLQKIEHSDKAPKYPWAEEKS